MMKILGIQNREFNERKNKYRGGSPVVFTQVTGKGFLTSSIHGEQLELSYTYKIFTCIIITRNI
jgi:hypothetical protein